MPFSTKRPAIGFGLTVSGMLAVILAGPDRRAEADSIPSYSVIDLGPIEQSAWSQGLAIGASGQVAGTAQTPAGGSQAFRGSQAGTIQVLGSLAGEQGNSQGLGVNGAGVVVGISDFGPGGRRAFRSDGDALVNLGTLSGGSWSHAVAINESGEIAGHGNRADGRTVAFRIATDGTFVELGTLAGGVMSRSFGINDHGHVVGESIDMFGVGRAFLADERGIHAVGTLPAGGGSVARAINNDGLITGYATDASGRDVAFVGRPGELVALGLLPGGRASYGMGINQHGQVVGHVTGTHGSRAFLWTAGGGMIDLNLTIDGDSGWVLQTASGINDAGMIVGTGLKDGVRRAFLLRLDPPDAPGGSGDPPGWIGPDDSGGSGGPHHHATPEPGSLVLVLFGAAGVGSWAWMRRRAAGPSIPARSPAGP